MRTQTWASSTHSKSLKKSQWIFVEFLSWPSSKLSNPRTSGKPLASFANSGIRTRLLCASEKAVCSGTPTFLRPRGNRRPWNWFELNKVDLINVAAVMVVKSVEVEGIPFLSFSFYFPPCMFSSLRFGAESIFCYGGKNEVTDKQTLNWSKRRDLEQDELRKQWIERERVVAPGKGTVRLISKSDMRGFAHKNCNAWKI